MRRGAQAPRQPLEAQRTGLVNRPKIGDLGRSARLHPIPAGAGTHCRGILPTRPPSLCELENNCGNNPFANYLSSVHQLRKLLTILVFLHRMPICCITAFVLAAKQSRKHFWCVFKASFNPSRNKPEVYMNASRSEERRVGKECR